MTDYGLKISKDGKDVATAANKDLIFSSELTSLKVKAKGTVSITTNGSAQGSGTVAHGLGYAPSYMVFSEVDPDTGDYFLSENIIDGSDPADVTDVHTKIDATNLTISLARGANNTTYDFIYYFFYDIAG